MFNIDKFVIKENGRFFLDLEEWKNDTDISIEDGDMIKFSFESKRYIGTVKKIGSAQESLFEFCNVKEIGVK
ncbi:MAG: hypothetical protein EBU90_01200 [Proteobacteria bacterium]|nr:hypothetical protein [Pseudomonadota bacterium]NBP12777.1 hypothetical protein [bacterium]